MFQSSALRSSFLFAKVTPATVTTENIAHKSLSTNQAEVVNTTVDTVSGFGYTHIHTQYLVCHCSVTVFGLF